MKEAGCGRGKCRISGSSGGGWQGRPRRRLGWPSDTHGGAGGWPTQPTRGWGLGPSAWAGNWQAAGSLPPRWSLSPPQGLDAFRETKGH